jgi:hypothetical protein
MTSSHSFLQSTVARNLDASKKAPLNFLLLARLVNALGEASPACVPIEGVRFSWWRRETMMQHGWDTLPDLSGANGPS